jgi:tRNA G18 (ribose-2'-O)-methylase SpoU
MALYLGTEGAGLPESLLKQMKTLRIAMIEGFDSLNVATAAAVALHHFVPAPALDAVSPIASAAPSRDRQD